MINLNIFTMEKNIFIYQILNLMMVLTLKIKGRRETNEMIDLKLASVKNIKILFADDTKIYLDYVISKYGKNYIKLYENKR